MVTVRASALRRSGDSSLLTRRDSFTDPLGAGWRLDRVRFEAMFRTAARERCGRLIAPARLTALAQCQKGGAGWRADLRCGDMDVSLGARFLILAHGRGPLPTVLDSTVTLQAFDRLVCRSRNSALSNILAFRFLARRGSRRRMVVSGYATRRTPHPRLSHRCGPPVRPVRLQSRRVRRAAAGDAILGSVSLPKDATVRRASARSEALDSCCGTDWCAVGDAAAAFDPLSSQGIFNALYTGVRGAEGGNERTERRRFGAAMLSRACGAGGPRLPCELGPILWPRGPIWRQSVLGAAAAGGGRSRRAWRTMGANARACAAQDGSRR